jgi:hypothetical protein
MRSAPHCFFSLVLVIAASFGATAETRILAAADKDRLAILATVTEFRTAIADGKTEAARALFAGDADNSDILAAFLDWTTSVERLRTALQAKYDPANFPNALLIAKGLHVQLEGLSGRIILVNGDRASISPLSQLDFGMRLRLVNGTWKVSHLTGRPIDAKPYARFLHAVAKAYQAADSDYMSGKLKSLEDVVERLNKMDDPAIRESLMEMASSDRRMPVEQAPPPAKWQPPAADLVARLPGTVAPSDDINRLMTSLPGIPYATGGEQIVTTFDDEAGIQIMQELKPPRRFLSIGLYARGVLGCAQYQGPLPHGLSFADTRAEVERGLGHPALIFGGTSRWPISAVYPKLGLRVYYATSAGRDPLNTITCFNLSVGDRNFESAPEVAAQPKPRIALRLVALDPAAKDVDLIADPSVPTHAVIPIEKLVQFDESAIASVSIVFALKPTDTNRLAVEMTAEGARLLKALSTQNNGRHLALIFDGRLIAAARMNGPLTDHITLEPPNSPSESQVVQLSGHLNAAVQTLPDAPAGKQ